SSPRTLMARAPANAGVLKRMRACRAPPLAAEASPRRSAEERIAMLNGPLLVTERLILRPPATEDFDAFAAMCAEEETMRFIGGACPRSAAWRLWCSLAGAWHIRGFSMFSVIEQIGRAHV